MARKDAGRSRTAPGAGAGASAAGRGDRAAGRPRGAARADRPSSPDGSPLHSGCPTKSEESPLPRAPRPEDLYRLRIATEPRLSPDGRIAVVTLQTVAPGFDRYRQAIWIVPTDGSAPARQLTTGARHDHHPRFAPDGRTLAFLSDRRLLTEDQPNGATGSARDREDASQLFLLPLDGGEARPLTELPRGLEAFEWSPDGTRLVVVSAARGSTPGGDARSRTGAARPPDAPPPPDYRFVDRLDYMLNGKGFIYDRI